MSGKAIRTAMKQAEIIRDISQETGVTQNDVRAVLNHYQQLAERHLKKGGAGEFKLHNLVKLDRVQRKARKARNPITGAEIKIPAKRVVRARALTALKSIEV